MCNNISSKNINKWITENSMLSIILKYLQEEYNYKNIINYWISFFNKNLNFLFYSIGFILKMF